MKDFSNKNIFDMTDKELEIDSLADNLTLKFIRNQIENARAVQFENYRDIIIFHPCVKDKEPYQVTYIWKKDNKPSGDILCSSLDHVAREIFSFLHNVKEYIPKKIISNT